MHSHIYKTNVNKTKLGASAGRDSFNSISLAMARKLGGLSYVTMALSGLIQSQGKKLFLCLSTPWVRRHLSGSGNMSSTSESLVTCDLIQDKKIAILSLNDPSKLNALSVPVGEALHGHIQQLKHEPDLRAVILTGKGELFEDWIYCTV